MYIKQKTRDTRDKNMHNVTEDFFEDFIWTYHIVRVA